MVHKNDDDVDISEPQHVLHMAPLADWERVAAGGAQAQYVDPSLDDEGFIHCSTPAQVLIPANERFAGRTDLVLLVIDLERVPSRTVFEDCYESGHKFPHIYGPIPASAVLEIINFPCEPDGSFKLPAALT